MFEFLVSFVDPNCLCLGITYCWTECVSNLNGLFLCLIRFVPSRWEVVMGNEIIELITKDICSYVLDITSVIFVLCK